MNALALLYGWYNIITIPIGTYIADKKGMLTNVTNTKESAKALGYICTWQYIEGYKLLKYLKNKI